MSLDRNEELDKRFVSGEPLSLDGGKKSSGGKQYIGADYRKDRVGIVLLDVTAGRYRVMS